MKVYLDYASTTPLLPEVIKAMLEVMENIPGNPSSIHNFGRRAKTKVEDSRKIIANILNASLSEVFFTSGASESNNLVLNGCVNDIGIERIITTNIEHHCILHTLDAIQRSNDKLEIVYLKVNEVGRINLEELRDVLQQSEIKTLVSVMHANNEIGTVQDIRAIGAICEACDALFHSDVAQSFGKYHIDVSDLNIDFLSIAAHKLFGPKGTGAVYIKNDHQISPMIYGGGQERNMRAGTENVIGIAGFAKAAEIAYQELEQRAQKTAGLRIYFEEQLLNKIPGIKINGDRSGLHLYNVSNISFPPNDKSDLLVFNLDISGIAVSSGSACSSGVETDSHVLNAIAHSPKRKAVRFSLSHLNTKEEIDYTIAQLEKLHS